MTRPSKKTAFAVAREAIANGQRSRAVEAATGDQVREALRPFLPHLERANPNGYKELTSGPADGWVWIAEFKAPLRGRWTPPRYPPQVAGDIQVVLELLRVIRSACGQTSAGSSYRYRNPHWRTAP